MRNKRGFSLLEVTLGSLLFATVFGALAMGWLMQERALRQFRDRNIARIFAEMELERCHGAGFRGVDTYVTTANAAPELRLTRTIDGAPTEAVYQREIALTVNPPGDIKTLVVTVTYSQANADDQTVSLESAMFYTAR